jgi:toxin ParE1/3/4
MSYNLVLTGEAQDDFEDILAYTQNKWGEGQRKRYAIQLNNALEMLEENPRLGTKYPKLPPIYQTYPVGRHYIIYRMEGSDVIVLRILHDRMDLPRHIQ